MSIYIEIYIYIGLLSGWWFSTKLSTALEKYEVNNKSIYWVTAIMFLLLWPITIWSANYESANQIAKNLRSEENK
jgi:hypothetical protein